MTKLELSTLGHTWILDLDGTILKHNGYREGGDQLLEGAKEFLSAIPAKDMIIIVTARASEYRQETESFLRANDVRFDHIIFDAPHGERILINDRKPGLDRMSVGLTVERNAPIDIRIARDVERRTN